MHPKLALSHRPSRHRGAALFVAIIFLLLVTSLGVVAAKQSGLQQKMTVGQRNVSMALASAESAARCAERRIYDWYRGSNGRALAGDGTATQGVYDPAAVEANTTLAPFFAGRAWSTAGATSYPTARFDFTKSAVPIARTAEQPHFVIEDLGPLGGARRFESGSSANAGYEGSMGLSPSGNAEDRVYRITAKGTGMLPGVVRTVQTTFSGRVKG